MTDMEIVLEPELTKEDRCDVCSAAASKQIIFGGGRDLLFCNHHFSKNRQAILDYMKDVSTDGEK